MNWMGFWRALTDTTEITVIVAVIVLVFIYSIFTYFSTDADKALRYARFTPSLLVSIGIFGTFLGIFFALVDFNVNRVDESIPELLSGLKVAFGTSIVGLFLSLAFRAIILYKPKKIKSTEEADVKDLLAKMTEVKDAISADNESSVITQLQKLRSETIDSLKEMQKSFSEFAAEMSQNNVNALIEAVQKVMEDFNAKINDQLGESFKELSSSVQNLVEWQNNYKTHVENLNDQLQTAISGITSSQESLKQISENMESLPKSTEALKDIMTTVQGQIDNLNNQLDAFAQMKDKAVDAMPTIEKNLNEMTESLSNSVSSIENMSTEIRDSVKQSIKETNDMLINQIKGLDEQMQKEVTKIVEIMGSNLASLSEKFVSDYSPLTNQLVNLVNSLGSVKKKTNKKPE
jgi:DNA anti-recombination protein RmuC